MTDRRSAQEQGARRLNRAARKKMDRPETTWFVVFARPGQEMTAQKLLRPFGGTAYLPLRRKWRRVNRYKRDKQPFAYPAIAGMLFVGFAGKDVPWFEIFRNLPSVYGVLSVAGSPATIPGARLAEFIADNRLRLSTRAEEKVMQSQPAFAEGDQVGIVGGPLAGQVGEVDKIDGAKAHMLLHLLGGPQKITLPLDLLEKAA